MPISIDSVFFELSNVYKTYAEFLLQSDSVARLLHNHANINATGNQIEISLRKLLSDLLPNKVHIGQGHIVDQKGSISYQQDLMISENLNSKSILKTLDETEFIPFESVYATCEIKKAWSKKTFNSTIKSIKHNKTKLSREDVSSNRIIGGGAISIESNRSYSKYPKRNSLFSMAFSIDYDKQVKTNAFVDFYNDRSKWSLLPNIVVILKKGIYMLIDERASNSNSLSIKLYPEFESENEDCAWYFFAEDENYGLNLALMVFILMQHIDDTILDNPSYLKYGLSMLKINANSLSKV